MLIFLILLNCFLINGAQQEFKWIYSSHEAYNKYLNDRDTLDRIKNLKDHLPINFSSIPTALIPIVNNYTLLSKKEFEENSKELISKIKSLNIQDVRNLLEAGADINSKDELKYSALIYAVMCNHIPMVELLIGKGADVNWRDNIGVTALMHATFVRNIKIAELLIENGANLDLQDKSGLTALMQATIRADMKMVKLLIRKGANTNLQDKDGWTASSYAFYYDNKEIVEILKNPEYLQCTIL